MATLLGTINYIGEEYDMVQYANHLELRSKKFYCGDGRSVDCLSEVAEQYQEFWVNQYVKIADGVFTKETAEKAVEDFQNSDDLSTYF